MAARNIVLAHNAWADGSNPPDAQRLFASRMRATTTEVDSSHVLMVSHPDDVASVVGEAASSV